ncbi:hypothetical protein CHUAL_002450 [Chamberlinius hualienensis]
MQHMSVKLGTWNSYKNGLELEEKIGSWLNSGIGTRYFGIRTETISKPKNGSSPYMRLTSCLDVYCCARKILKRCGSQHGVVKRLL